tara:strand:- start:146 stop:283 length:138 start_codon:yes stop_codon:yes gene_type:complete
VLCCTKDICSQIAHEIQEQPVVYDYSFLSPNLEGKNRIPNDDKRA